MKKKYVKPVAFAVLLAKEMTILGSRPTETSEQMAKETDFNDNDWFSDEVKDYTEIWSSESEKWK